MSLLSKIEKMNKSEEKISKENQVRHSLKMKALDDERDVMYRKLKNILIDLNGKSYKKLNLSVKESKKENYTIELFVNNKIFLIFSISMCHWWCSSCEGPCEHEDRYWHVLDVRVKTDKEGIYDNVYFDYGVSNDLSEDRIAKSLKDKLEMYDWYN